MKGFYSLALLFVVVGVVIQTTPAQIVDDFEDFDDLGSGSGNIPLPICKIEGGVIKVYNLAPAIGCVMRDDTYAETVPVNGETAFNGPVAPGSNVGVEIYYTREGPRHCTGYIATYGTIFCEDSEISINSENSKSEVEEDVSAFGSGLPGSIICIIDEENKIQVSGLDQSVGCVIRNDIYTASVPVGGDASFAAPTVFAGTGVEIYSEWNGPRDCTGYQAVYGTVPCTGNTNTRPLPPPPPPGFLEYDIPKPTCSVDETGIISVGNLDPIIGCVIRTDTWFNTAPADGAASFSEPTVSNAVGIEIYKNLDGPGPQNCSEFIPKFGTIWCGGVETVPDESGDDDDNEPDPEDFPVCSIVNNQITITNVDIRAQCILRVDTYSEIAPVNQAAVFSEPATPGVGIELYTSLNGPSDCTGFISEYGTVPCVQIITDESSKSNSESVDESSLGSGVTPPNFVPACDVVDGLLVVTGLGSSVNCVLRTDTYEAAVPSAGIAAFSAPIAAGVGVELYTNYNSNGDCDGFISFFGAVPCAGNPNDGPDPNPPTPGKPLKYPNLAEPVCTVTNGVISVTNLAPEIGCVVRVDTWSAAQPADGSLQFSGITQDGQLGIEIYESYTGNDNCEDFIPNFGTIFCTVESLSTEEDGPGTGSEGGEGGDGSLSDADIIYPVCTVEDGVITVTSVDPIASCVLRTDTYNKADRVGDAYVFPNADATLPVQIELYESDEPEFRLCSKFLTKYGSVECTGGVATSSPDASKLDDNDSGSGNTGIIIGAAAGGLALLALIVAALVYRKKKKSGQVTFDKFDTECKQVMA
eukprot:Nk52_evm6s164 gene=Nk52_evmTU6s164